MCGGGEKVFSGKMILDEDIQSFFFCACIAINGAGGRGERGRGGNNSWSPKQLLCPPSYLLSLSLSLLKKFHVLEGGKGGRKAELGELLMLWDPQILCYIFC